MNSKSRPKHWLFLTALFGPGLVVMLADTDAGSVITAAQSGAEWRYKLLLLQFILMPVLFIAQELTVRLGIVTRHGHGELIKKHFGSFWAWISVSALIISCIGAIITEFTGIAGVGDLFKIPTWLSVGLAALFLATIVYSGSYRSVERIAIILGLFELIFFIVAWHANPSLSIMLQDFYNLPILNPKYLYLVAANIGAVIMPWMIFYQQSAVIDKGLQLEDMGNARINTAIGAVVTQLVMAAVLVAVAATIDKTGHDIPLNTVQEISHALTPFLGKTIGVVLFSIGMLGSAMVAAIVVSLTAAWALGEVTGYQRSLTCKIKNAPWFYGVYTLMLVIGIIIVLSGLNFVKLDVAIEVMNALLLPIVLGFLFLLARKTLPEEYKLKGAYAVIVAIVLLITVVFGFVGALS